MKKAKVLFNSFVFLDLFYLGFLVLRGNLFDTNLSRVCNSFDYGYLLLNMMTLIFGIISCVTLEKMKLNKYKYLGLLSLILGSIIKYDPTYPNATNSNVHLLFAYISLFTVTIIQIIKMFYFKLHKPKISDILTYTGVIIFAYNLYTFLDIGYVNSFAEWIYLSYLLISDLIIYNSVVEKD